MSCRKKIGWRGPLRSPVSLMTGAWYLGVDCALKAAADRAKHSHTARVFVINAMASMANGFRRLAGPRMYPRRGTAHKTSLGARQQLVFQPNHVDERGDGFEVGKLHPAVSHASRDRS